MRVKSYIGIGSNIGDPLQQVKDALALLDQVRDTRLLGSSSLYRSEPVSDVEQEDFINAVACLSTSLQPMDLLLELQAIERAFYRTRQDEVTWGPRTMDLDIILYGHIQQNDSHLVIPHPEMHHRLFVLQPLKEVAGDLYIPGLGSLNFLIAQAPSIRMRRIDPVN